MAHNIEFRLNGSTVSESVTANLLLVDLLRDRLRLTGTHVACDTSQCGACVIHVNGRSVKSCSLLAVQVDGCDLTTIEGLARGAELHPLQAAFRDCHGLQCGFCTPGMIMSALDLLQRDSYPDEQQIRQWLEGNICRCTGYHNIVRAIQAAAASMRGDAVVQAMDGD
ncbi:MAG TPA: (2Fe-2S)-binding protein [Woeseiaceae bacterium]